jgi:hypothetical protein
MGDPGRPAERTISPAAARAVRRQGCSTAGRSPIRNRLPVERERARRLRVLSRLERKPQRQRGSHATAGEKGMRLAEGAVATAYLPTTRGCARGATRPRNGRADATMSRDRRARSSGWQSQRSRAAVVNIAMTSAQRIATASARPRSPPKTGRWTGTTKNGPQSTSSNQSAALPSRQRGCSG